MYYMYTTYFVKNGPRLQNLSCIKFRGSRPIVFFRLHYLCFTIFGQLGAIEYPRLRTLIILKKPVNYHCIKKFLKRIYNHTASLPHLPFDCGLFLELSNKNIVEDIRPAASIGKLVKDIFF